MVPFRFLLAIAFAAFALEICTSLVFAEMANNYLFYHIDTPIEFALYSFFFSSLGMSKKINKAIYLIIPFYITTSILFSLFVQESNINNSYMIVLGCTIIMLYALLYLRHLNIAEIDTKAERNPYFWITTGILINFIGVFFIEGCLNLLLVLDENKALTFYKIGFVFKHLMCCMFLIGIFVSRINKN